MPKLTKITRNDAKNLRIEATEALEAVAKKYGLLVQVGNARYSNDSYRTKFEFSVAATGVATTNGIVVSKADVDAALELGLPEDIVGREFKSRGTTYTVTGFNLKRWKYPVGGTGPKGGRYKFTADRVRIGLVGGTAVAA